MLVLYKNYGGATSSTGAGVASSDPGGGGGGVSYRAFFTTITLWAGLLLCAANIFGLCYWPAEFRRAKEETGGERDRLTDGLGLRESVSDEGAASLAVAAGLTATADGSGREAAGTAEAALPRKVVAAAAAAERVRVLE